MNPDDPKGEPQPRITGAYEETTYGAGLAYAGLVIPASEIRYIGAVATLPPGATLDDLGPAERMVELGDGLSARIIRPLLWSGHVADGKRPSVWPVILDFGDPRGRAPLGVGPINDVLSRIALPVEETWRRRDITGRLKITLNAPLTAASVGNPFVRPLTEPFTPDPALQARLAAGGRLAVVAVIDDGLPFAHRGLLDSTGATTRMQFCWLQSGIASAIVPGVEFTRDTINALVAAHGPDEDAVYTRAGAIETTPEYSSTLMHFASHGAHVLDAACGLRPDEDDAMDHVLAIGVQLAAPVTIDTSGYGKSFAILTALHYIFDRAERIAEAYLGSRTAELPLVINFSYGFSGGPHDGTGNLELAVEDLIRTRRTGSTGRPGMPTELVMPAGNTFGESMNAVIPAGTLRTGRGYDIGWRVQPNNTGMNYLEIWLPAAQAGQSGARLDLTLTAPDGAPCQASAALQLDLSAPLTWPGVSAALTVAGRPAGTCTITRYNAGWLLALFAVNPSEPLDATLPAAPSGVWTITLTKTGGGGIASPVACRIQRDNDPFGYRRGARQSRFEDPLEERFTADGAPSRVENPAAAFVRRFGSINGLATHREVTVVSSLYGDTGRPTPYGSAGPMPSTGRGDVSLSVQADDATVLPGLLSAGTRSGSSVRLSGTSMAAAMITRLKARGHAAGNAPFTPSPPSGNMTPEEFAEAGVRLGVQVGV